MTPPKPLSAIAEEMAAECANKIEAFAWDDDMKFVQKAKPEIAKAILAGAEEMRKRAEGVLLETIKDVIRNSSDIVAKKLCSQALAQWEAQK